MKIVNGSSLAPASGKPPKQIVLLLHGYGSKGADLISLARHWQAALPDALFLAPNAPSRLSMGGGYQWWPLTDIEPRALAEGAARAAPAIDAFINRKLQQYALTDAQLAIVGFSQGTMMALHVGLRRGQKVAGIVGYSGTLTGAHELKDDEITKPPVLLVHGSADAIVPLAASYAAKADLERLGMDVTVHVSGGVGHSVDPVGLKLGGEFLSKSLLG